MVLNELKARLEAKEQPTEAEILRAIAELERLTQENKTLWRVVGGER